ncbi:uncharacterized protein LOC112270051 [Brachypodium distachyon]|uniref:uncharacterized protein LOC112270051 n=1 Tax=Brachypodium distachyon TaxID=15368 RepID=UPI000D0D5009|nr:uncharacterized protein LOC112270051 [Brachypodium distachyon]|eukprot:XP_024313477.1 uncharacterized protein LOC112270051 [Brachypodium distachyon]
MPVLGTTTTGGTKEEGPVLEAELCLLRRSGGWELKRLPVLHDKGKRRELSCWVTDAAAPVGDRFLCWVDYFRGVIFSDVSRESPELRYVSLPVKPDLTTYYRDGRGGSSYRSVCATGGGGMVMFVEVFPRALLRRRPGDHRLRALPPRLHHHHVDA